MGFSIYGQILAALHFSAIRREEMLYKSPNCLQLKLFTIMCHFIRMHSDFLWIIPLSWHCYWGTCLPEIANSQSN